MDFDAAIQAHVEWKTKIRAYIMKRDGTVNSSIVRQDNQCALGKWIYGEGSRYSNLTEYATLKAVHAGFHHVTAQVIEMVNAGKVQQAIEMLKSGSEFMKLSSQCVTLIMQLRQKSGN